jgi:alkaline phosphatase D
MKNYKIIFLLFAVLISVSLFAQREKAYCDRLSYSLDPAFAPFYHGVASGDPLSDRVIIWTRITPSSPADSIPVDWHVATDTSFLNIVANGTFYTNEDRDWTVKVDVTGLQPDTWYYYYFRGSDQNSIIGRTKTISEGNTDSLRIAVFSGSNYNNGYFNVYQSAAERNDVDMMFHLGDYIYEYGTGEYGDHSDRELVPGHEILTLSDYRMRYSHYRLDPDLRLAHQQYPWYVIYDDHETANDSWTGGAENHDPDTQGEWEERKSAGIQAFKEWIPLREINDPANPDNHIHRNVDIGDLASFIFLDTRLEGRDDPEDLPNDDPNKTMLGANQKTWMKNELSASQSTGIQWKFLSQQVMFAPLKMAGVTLNSDQWDGYAAERQEILNYIYGMNINNVVILTGDIHTSWANDVPNPTINSYGSNGQGSGCVEFVTTSVTSPSVDFGQGVGAWAIQQANPHIKWVNLIERGYFILDVNTSRCQADWYFANTIDNTTFNEQFAQAYYVNDGDRYLQASSVPSVRLDPNPPLSPLYPDQLVKISGEKHNQELVLMGIYPNPVKENFTIQYYSDEGNLVTLEIYNINGQLVYQDKKEQNCSDLNYMEVNASGLKSGNYILKLTNHKGHSISKQFIKTK